MNSALVTVEGATKNFGGVKALINSDLTLYTKEIHTLLGENGAGKSTLLKTITEVRLIDAESITLDAMAAQEVNQRWQAFMAD